MSIILMISLFFFKWGKQLLKEGIQISIKYAKEEFEKKQADLYVISNRFKFSDAAGLKNLVNSLKQKGKKVALLDANDTSGLVNFDLINDVDFIIKKQVLKDRQAYTINNYDLSVRPGCQTCLKKNTTKPMFPALLTCYIK